MDAGNKRQDVDVFQYELSIIIPVYNVREYICDCLSSVLLQINSCVQIVIVDDGSNDGSGCVARAFVSSMYPKKMENILFLEKENGGLSTARNYGVAHASGRYVLFLDADDVVHRSLISSLIEEICCDNLDMISFNHIRFNDSVPLGMVFHESNTIESRFVDKQFYLNKGFYACNKVFNIDLVRKYPFPNGVDFEDVCTIPLLLVESTRIKHFDMAFYGYRVRQGSITRQKSVAEKLSCALEYLSKKAIDSNDCRFIHNCIAKETLSVLLSVIRCRNYNIAIYSLLKHKSLCHKISFDKSVFRIGIIRYSLYLLVKYLPVDVWKVIFKFIHAKYI